MGTAIKHPEPERVKPSECPDVKNCKWQLNPLWHRMLYPYDNSGRQKVY